VADLIIRAGNSDAALIERVLGGRLDQRPHRITVDAHVAATTPRISAAARQAGAPLLVDPQTHYLQALQHRDDPWAQLPFADWQAQAVVDLLDAARQDELAAKAVSFQLEHGASAVIPPYVHIERADNGWMAVQIGLWRATRRFLDRRQIRMPVVAVLALGWPELDRAAWPGGLRPLQTCLRHELRPTDVALAASKVDQGVHPAERLSGLIAVVRQLRRHWPVLAWQQGTLGEAAVAAGAAGYECGIGWRERCDLLTQMRAHTNAPLPGPRGPRPVFITALGQSLPKRSVELLMRDPRVAAQLTCMDAGCCPAGQQALLQDARAHALAARRRSLDLLTRPAQPAWRWNVLAQDAAAGLALAARINALAKQVPGLTRVDTGALAATMALADHRRQTLRRRAA